LVLVTILLYYPLQQAITIPMMNIERLWRDYNTFEQVMDILLMSTMKHSDVGPQFKVALPRNG
jgi:hypothetical protein